jgi:hypothetical protein
MFKSLFVMVLAVAALVLSTPIFAKACKGMSSSSCSKSTSCSWVKAYKTKSGSTVAAYCRNKAGKKSSTKKTSDKKITHKSKTTSTKKDTKKDKKKDSKKDKKKTDKSKSTKKKDSKSDKKKKDKKTK